MPEHCIIQACFARPAIPRIGREFQRIGSGFIPSFAVGEIPGGAYNGPRGVCFSAAGEMIRVMVCGVGSRDGRQQRGSSVDVFLA